MTEHCWNCQFEAEGRFCPRCGQPLRPNFVEARRASDRIEYLLAEMSQWAFMPDDVRDPLTQQYRARQERLKAGMAVREAALRTGAAAPEPSGAPVAHRVQIGSGAPPKHDEAAAALEPADTPSSQPDPRPGLLPPELEAQPELDAPPEAFEPQPEGWAGALSAFFEERNIRWFHTAGALLLLSAGIGYLRATWGGMGRQIVALLLVGSPVFCFWWAHRLKERLPLSSRLLSVLGGLLLPTGLLAVNHFHVLGLDLPAEPYNAFAMLVTAAVLLQQARQLQEIVSLYLGTVALGLCGFWLSSLAGSPLPLGLVALAGAFGYLRAGHRTQTPLGRHLVALSQLQALLAVASTLGELPQAGWSPLIPFFLSALFFASTAHLLSDARSLVISAAAALGAGWLLVQTLELPLLAFGYSALFVGAAYLAAGTLFEEAGLARLSRGLGTAVTCIVLVPLLGGQLLQGLWNNFADLDRADLGTAVLISLLAAVFFAACARLDRSPTALYGSALCVGYGYFAAVVLVYRASPQLYPLFLSGLPFVLVGVSLLLRGRVPAAILAPFVHLGVGLATMSGPLAVVLEVAGVAGSEPVSPWVFATTGSVFLLTTLWSLRAEPLYLGFTCLAVAYARWMVELVPNLGLAFLPLVLLVSLAALRAARSWGHEYGLALGRSAMLAAVFFCLSQAYYVSTGDRATAALTLVGYAVLFAWGAAAFADWGARRLTVLACLCGAVALLAFPGEALGKLLMMGAGLAGMLVARRLDEGHAWKEALAFTPLAYSSWIAFVPGLPGEVHGLPAALLCYGPALFWLLAPLGTGGARVAFGLCLVGSITVTGTGAGAPAAAALAGLAAVLFGFLAVRRGEAELSTYSWFVAGIGWLFLSPDSSSGMASLVKWWSVFNALALAAWMLARRGRPELAAALQSCTLLTAGMVIAMSLGIPAPGQGVTSLGYAAVLLPLGWLVRDRATFAAGSLLLQLGCFQLGADDGWYPLMAAFWGGLLLALAREIPDELRGWIAPYTAGSGWMASGMGFLTAVSSSSAFWLGVLGLLAAAVLWQARYLFGLGGGNHAVAYGSVYLAWAFTLQDLQLSTLELYILPPAAWALFWSHRWYARGEAAAAQAGLAGAAILLLPPILASTGSGMAGHALFAGAAATGLLVWGVGSRLPGLAVWGSLGLAAEMTIQLFHLSVVLPWQLTAALLGVLLVGLGVLFERKRAELIKTTRQVLKGLS
ncbi:MAG: hypothetical protein HY319_05285 [Armatimonadetes bacterium]|nr:hypothetical protein [Armatimonadota bacterium]